MTVFLSDDDIEIEGYIVNRKDRNSFGGGVAIYMHNTIQFSSAIPAISSQLAVIFNQCIEQGIFPDD